MREARLEQWRLMHGHRVVGMLMVREQKLRRDNVELRWENRWSHRWRATIIDYWRWTAGERWRSVNMLMG
jgi:hypothetical protein